MYSIKYGIHNSTNTRLQIIFNILQNIIIFCKIEVKYVCNELPIKVIFILHVIGEEKDMHINSKMLFFGISHISRATKGKM